MFIMITSDHHLNSRQFTVRHIQKQNRVSPRWVSWGGFTPPLPLWLEVEIGQSHISTSTINTTGASPGLLPALQSTGKSNSLSQADSWLTVECHSPLLFSPVNDSLKKDLFVRSGRSRQSHLLTIRHSMSLLWMLVTYNNPNTPTILIHEVTVSQW